MKTILVTGSPRSGTTPVGDLLTRLPHAASLYEPMGLTGDRELPYPFPTLGQSGFDQQALAAFLDRIQRKNIKLKSQIRPGAPLWRKLIAPIVGSRTATSLRALKRQSRTDWLIWKDPHAAFLAADVAAMDIPVVLTARHPCAHAASFKRLGWVSKARDVYHRAPDRFAHMPALEGWLADHGDTPLGSAACLWAMIYAGIVRDGLPKQIFFMNPERLAADELASYAALFDWLGTDFPTQARDIIASRQSGEVAAPKGQRVHDFSRSAAAANSYWTKSLTTQEADLVLSITGPIWDALSSS